MVSHTHTQDNTRTDGPNTEAVRHITTRSLVTRGM